MARTIHTSAKSSPKSSPTDNDGNPIHNEILLDLPRKGCDVLLSKLEFVRLRAHHVLHEPGDTLKSAYFCNSGLISILSVFPDGKCVEVGLVGKEGFVGLPLVAGFPTAATRAITQIDATAFRVDAAVLKAALTECPGLELKLEQFAQMMTMQVTQIAACNQLHEVNQRLARWLLMSADRIGSNSLPLVQEFLAQMLGTRRASVTVSAGRLEKAGMIACTRGEVKITNRKKLEQAACPCYGIMRHQAQEWQGQT